MSLPVSEFDKISVSLWTKSHTSQWIAYKKNSTPDEEEKSADTSKYEFRNGPQLLDIAKSKDTFVQYCNNQPFASSLWDDLQERLKAKRDCAHVEQVLKWFLTKYGEPTDARPLTSIKLSLEGRGTVLDKIVSSAVERLSHNGDGIKDNHPFNVIYGAPGIGKTRVLEAISKRTAGDHLLPVNQVNINISFNSTTPYNREKLQDSTTVLTLSTRILYRYFVDELCFEYISAWIKSKNPSIVTCDNLGSMTDKSKLILINLGLDEFQRTLNDSKDPDERRSVLKAIIRDNLAGLLTNAPLPFFLNITLCGTVIGDITTVIHKDSSHPFTSIPLPFLSQDAVKRVCESAGIVLNQYIERALMFTSGWPRPLSIMIKSIKNGNPLNKTSDILGSTRERFLKHYGRIDKNIYPIIIAYSLTGISLSLNTKVPNTDITFEQLQSNGLLVLDNNVVKLPPYFIYIYVDYQPDNLYVSHLRPLYYNLKLALNTVQDGDFGFEQFETFCAHYQAARMISFHLIMSDPKPNATHVGPLPSQPITFGQLFGRSSHFFPLDLNNKIFSISNSIDLVNRPPHHEPETTGSMNPSTIILNYRGGKVDIVARSAATTLDQIGYLFNSMKFTDNSNTLRKNELQNNKEVKLARILGIQPDQYSIVLQSTKRLTNTMRDTFLKEMDLKKEHDSVMKDAKEEVDEEELKEEEEEEERKKRWIRRRTRRESQRQSQTSPKGSTML
ncbi:hypothetical protein SAMD00019534_028170 [Acytostelium subglobosum LB1]|uniref:hypothetical protein n=1 Tax=Acytostelium subglobosum LB1 TaxID=1410327 RepID=UPI000644DF09|nr:hypothetical protein SAMD00019534_028170 [Acytostelium subglobosum LB1]GAM19642.1 hypothetical protein SAMD00019534_028170 [Acytostelium subglobosum LB1]|eukprot:XP_012756404.1 hypothetical protein SAMD00019534_028170 [Acytostelium subglobosum LB1]